MSWYISQDGERLWIGRDETVFTLVESEEKKLPLENLTYLTVQSKKAVYHEHICNEDLLSAGKSRVPRRKRDQQSGRQRGFILRAEVEETPLQRVVPAFKAAAQKLVDDGEVSRVDADDAVNAKRKKGKEKVVVNLNLGVNECRVETTARVNHFAHGLGYRVEVAQGSVTQRIHFFTHRHQIPFQEWTELLVEAIEGTGSHVMLAQRVADDQASEAKQNQDTEGRVKVTKTRRDRASQEDETWLQRMMNMAGGEDVEGSDSASDSNTGADSGTPSVQPATAAATAAAAPVTPQSPEGEAVPRGLPYSAPSTRDHEVRDWRNVRDPPHVGYTRDWGHQRRSRDGWQDWSSWKPRGSDGRQSRWSEQPHERAPQDDNWRSRGVLPSEPCARPKNDRCWEKQGPAGDSRPRQERNAERNGRAAAQGQIWGQRGRPATGSTTSSKTQQPESPQAQARKAKNRSTSEESKTKKVERDQAVKCFECGRGKPLKLFIDEDDGNPYCHKCWVEFYGLNPPQKP